MAVEALRHCKKCLILSRVEASAPNGGGIHLLKNSGRASTPGQRGREKNIGPLSIREFVALFCTKGRDKRRGWGWEVVDGQGVKNFEESAETHFGPLLLPRRAGT